MGKTWTRGKARWFYGIIRQRSEAKSPEAFNAAFLRELHRFPTPLWVPSFLIDIARKLTFTCRRCAGTGSFITGTVNGIPSGPGGICFRCQGFGSQNDHDVARNEVHDRHYMARGL